MRRVKFCWLVPCGALLLIAADPVWKDKPIASWSEADARQILEHSPWAKTVTAGIARRQTEDERREGGNMGQATGVGYDGVDPIDRKKQLAKVLQNPLTIDRTPPHQAPNIPLLVRWESALPVRAAEVKVHEPGPPTLSDDGYSIAVYGVPPSYVKGDPASLGKPLKGLAALKREGQKDVLPSSVEVFQLEGGMAVVYLFPLSAEISKKDTVVEFTALIGRLQVSQHFLIQEMQFLGKLEL